MCALSQTKEHTKLSDEDIVIVAKNGDKQAQDYICCKYKYLVVAKTSAYYLTGGDRDDLFQEGMIGLFKAMRDYKKDRGIPFSSFAAMCIERQIITAVKTFTRRKHAPLNWSASLDRSLLNDDEEGFTLMDVLASKSELDPVEILTDKECVMELKNKLREILTSLEFKSLLMVLNGMTYQDVAKKLNKNTKSIDNALQRARSKLSRYLEEKSEMENV